MNEKNGLKLKTVFLLFALVPLMTAILILSVITTRLLVDNLEENTFEELKTAAQGLRSYYEYDIINNLELKNGFVEYAPEEYIDVVYDSTQINLTLFKENVRYMTSLRNSDGTRNEGTKASTEVWNAVKKGNDYHSNSVDIGGIEYFVYYMPIKNGRDVIGMSFAGKPAEDINTSERNMILLVVDVGIGLTFIFTIISLIISKKMSDPIKEVADKLQILSEGRTNIELEKTSHISETNILKKSTENLKSKLGDIIASITNNTNELNQHITGTTANASQVAYEMNQISNSMNGLADSTSLLTESVQNINLSVSNMDSIMKTANVSVSELKDSMQHMTNANKEMHTGIDSVVKSGKESAEAISSITQTILDTSQAIDKIGEMVKLINDIASQTNLLSLNASIEAARAGESGRGFSVVASEIGKLAQDSNKSTEKIRTIVSEVTALSTKCVNQTESLKDTMTEQQKILETTLKKFNMLNSEIDKSANHIENVADITNQLSNVESVIMNAVTDLSSISEETTATNQEIIATVETVNNSVNSVSDDMTNMTKLSSELTKTVSFFKV